AILVEVFHCFHLFTPRGGRRTTKPPTSRSASRLNQVGYHKNPFERRKALSCGSSERGSSVRSLLGSEKLLLVERQHAFPVVLQVRGPHEQMAFPAVAQVGRRLRQPLHFHPDLVRMLDDRQVRGARLDDQG